MSSTSSDSVREVSEHLRIGMENAIAGTGAYRRRPVPRRPPCRADRETRSAPSGVSTSSSACTLTTRQNSLSRSGKRPTASGAHGTHQYDPADFGLSAGQIRSDYDFYIEHFGVEVEGER